MTTLMSRPAWASIMQVLLTIFAWFIYVWIGLRLVHVYHDAMEASLHVVGALATQVAVFADMFVII